MTAALPLLSSAVATLGIALFAVFAWRTAGAAARTFSFLCLALATWTGVLFVQGLFPRAVPVVLPWMASALLPPLSFAFVAAQGHWASRWLRRAAVGLSVPAVASIVALLLIGEVLVPAVALYLFPSLLAALVVLAMQEARGRPAGSEHRLRGIVIAGAVCVAAALLDTLPWFGVERFRGWPRLAPLSSLLLVALLGTAIARHGLYRLRPRIGGAVTVAACALAVAALLDGTVPRLAGDAVGRMLWIWFVVLLFLLFQGPLVAFLRRPFVRDLEQRRRALLEGLEQVEGVLATSPEEAQLLRQAEALLQASPEVQRASLRIQARSPDPGATAPEATDRSPPSSQYPLESQGQSLGRLELQWVDHRLARDELVHAAMRSFCARVATALLALRLQAEVQRRESLARLGTMAAGIAHEIKNPLGAILGALDLLDAESLGEPGRRWIQIARDESGRMNRLVTDVLTLGKEVSLEVAPVDVATFLEGMGEVVREVAGPHGVRVEVRTGPDLGVVPLDADHLRHALLNLMLNAVEVQKGAGGRIDVQAIRQNGELVIHVRDDGPGIPDDIRPHIFDPFFTTRSAGTGLGLAIAHQVVVGHGGSVRLEPPDAGLAGAHFVIRLPAGGGNEP